MHGFNNEFYNIMPILTDTCVPLLPSYFISNLCADLQLFAWALATFFSVSSIVSMRPDKRCLIHDNVTVVLL